MTSGANKDQEEYWGAAQKWIDYQDNLDATLEPVLTRTLDAARLAPGEAVLDIGCGTGASIMAAARQVGVEGHVLGADISGLLLSRAEKRVADAGVVNANLLRVDAQEHEFENAAYDVVISRFGVMFFADPVAAFANIARAVKPGGRLAFMAWAALEDNPWFEIPRQVAVARLGEMPLAETQGPNPVAFADRAYVHDLLAEAGWADISVTATEVDLTPPGGAAGAAAISCRVGIAARILRAKDGSEEDAHAIEAEVTRMLAQYDGRGGMRVPAVLNLCLAWKK